MEFLRKHAFWVGIGLLCLVAVGLHFAIVVPMAAKNAKLMEDLNLRRKKLKSYKIKGKQLKNERWIKYANEHAREWDRCRGQCVGFCKDQEVFPDVFRDSKGNVIRSSTMWASEFKVRCRKLLKQLREKKIGFGEITFKFQEEVKKYQRMYPRPDEQRAVTRDFFIQEEFIKALMMEKLQLASIDSLKIGADAADIFKPFPEVKREGVYDSHPYVLAVHMEFENILFLLKELLASKKLGLTIERIAVKRSAVVDKKRSDLVEIVVMGRYMDYSVSAQQ